MSDTITYKAGAMTLEDFREIVRSLQNSKPERIDPFEQIRNNPLFHKSMMERINEM